MRRITGILMTSIWIAVSMTVMLSASYAAIMPIVTSATPSEGSRGQTLDVTIRGRNFTGTRWVSFGTGGDIHVNSFRVRSSTEIRANIRIYETAGLGPYDIHVHNPDGTGKGIKLFTIAGEPRITSVTPANGVRGSSLDVTIVGEGFYGTTGVSFGEGIEVSYRVISEYRPVMIQASLRITLGALPGAKDVTVRTTHGTTTANSAFTVTRVEGLAPVVNSVTPSSGMVGQSLNITIKGRNFTGSPAIRFNPSTGVTINGSPERRSGEEVRANITIARDAPQGPRDVTVVSGSLEGTGRGLFRVETLR